MNKIRISFVLITIAFLFFTTLSALADDDEMYEKWYSGDWMARTEDLDGQQVWYGLRIAKSKNILGCIMYPNKNGFDRKLFGEIIDTSPNEIEIRLSNGNEIEFKKIGKEPNNAIKLIKHVKGGHLEADFQREFLPSVCI